MKKCNNMASVRKMAKQLDSKPLVANVLTSSSIEAIVEGDASIIAATYVATASVEVHPIQNDEPMATHFDISQEVRDNMMTNDEVSELHLPMDAENESFGNVASDIGNDRCHPV